MSNHYTAKVAESLKLRGWIDEIQAKSLRSACDKKDAEIVRLKGERDAAIKEANRRDQKWMDGINEAVGRKLDYGDPCSRDNASKALSEIIIERDEAKVARDFAELACQRKEADAAVMRGLLSDSKRVLSRVMDWCLMDSPNFEIDGDAIGEAVHNINVFEGKSTLNPKPHDVK